MLAARAAIVDVQLDYAFGIDTRDWVRYRSVFQDMTEFDFTSWHGGAARIMPADEWVEQVRLRQSGFDGTQHLMSNHRVSIKGSEAHCTTYVVARHYLKLDGEHHVQAIGGYYDNLFVKADEKWTIARCCLNVLWTEGDPGLFDIAAARYAGRQTL